MIAAVVFDLDGVLIDSEPVWERVRRELVAERGGEWAPDAQRKLMCMSTQEWARYLSEDPGVGLPPAEVARLVIDRMAASYREHLLFLPGAVEAVHRLAARTPSQPWAKTAQPPGAPDPLSRAGPWRPTIEACATRWRGPAGGSGR